LNDYEIEGKKKSIKDLLRKLSERKISINESLESTLEKRFYTNFILKRDDETNKTEYN